MTDEVELYQTNHADFYLKLYRLSPAKTWTKLRVEIWQYSTQQKIGEYERNYSFLNTFWVFECKNELYALYAKNYTATRVLKLIDGLFIDWCGEEVSSYGFCPIDFFVPTATNWDKEDCPEEQLDFGFVAGCIWGDDSSWKIQHLDLSEIHNKILTRSEKYGYISLPWALRLKDAIDTDTWLENKYMKICVETLWHEDKDGKIIKVDE